MKYKELIRKYNLFKYSNDVKTLFNDGEIFILYIVNNKNFEYLHICEKSKNYMIFEYGLLGNISSTNSQPIHILENVNKTILRISVLLRELGVYNHIYNYTEREVIISEYDSYYYNYFEDKEVKVILKESFEFKKGKFIRNQI